MTLNMITKLMHRYHAETPSLTAKGTIAGGSPGGVGRQFVVADHL